MTKSPTGHDYATALTAVAFLLAAHPELTVPRHVDVTLCEWSEQPLVNVSLEQGAELAESENAMRSWAQLMNEGDYKVSAHQPDTPEFWTHVGFHGVVFAGLHLSVSVCHHYSKDSSEAQEPTPVAA